MALLFALLGWFSVIAQFYIMMENRIFSVSETVVRFFSFFTILTNIIVAIYFTTIFFSKKGKPAAVEKPGILTSVTLYIFMVGAVYQLALRHIWEPQGLQGLVDELLHTVIPVLVIIFCFLYEVTRPVKYSQVFKWASIRWSTLFLF